MTQFSSSFWVVGIGLLFTLCYCVGWCVIQISHWGKLFSKILRAESNTLSLAREIQSLKVQLAFLQRQENICLNEPHRCKTQKKVEFLSDSKEAQQ